MSSGVNIVGIKIFPFCTLAIIGSVGQDYDNAYATTNDLATSGTKRGLATYTTATDTWTYLENDDSNQGTFSSGTGYSMKKGTSTGTVSFTGTLNTEGVDVTLSTDGNRFNLLGNPYTSYINSATFLSNSESPVSETKTIWVWNQTLSTDGAYEVKILSQAFMIAPSQGFSSITNLTYVNPAITLGAGLDIRVAVSPGIGFFARGLYLHDLSNQYWYSNGSAQKSRDLGSPPTSLSRFSVSFGISFMSQLGYDYY